jgi:hypothetical protein
LLVEARRNIRQGLKLQRSRRNSSRCSKLVHGVAFLCGITTPSLSAQGGQRRFSYFNIERDNSLICWRFGIARATAHRRWQYGLNLIAYRLNGRRVPAKRSHHFGRYGIKGEVKRTGC